MGTDTNINNKITIGILAHVDAGKTTLAEALLYNCGTIKSLGRVDKGDTYLDTFELERKRGITIFSKQARFSLPVFGAQQTSESGHNNVSELNVTLIDTPGHVDFASEAERTLSVLDYAVLIISGVDGVQSHTSTLFGLLKHYNIPTFIFVNKMDIANKSESDVMNELSSELSDSCISFSSFQNRAAGQAAVSEALQDILCDENLASVSESLMNEYLEKGLVSLASAKEEIRNRQVFPCFFGSALKNDGIKGFLAGLSTFINPYTPEASPYVTEKNDFKAIVYKITRDTMNNRLTWMKILSGVLHVKDEINGEKVNQLRLYSSEKYEVRDDVSGGDITAVTGLTATSAGTLITTAGEETALLPLLSPVMSYKLILPVGTDIHHTYRQLLEIAEELPEISLVISEDTGEIQAQIMGEIQIEILESLIKSRLNLEVGFGVGTIIYKETVAETSEGVGHFEPLRHYAEAHLKIEPNERGRGIEVFSDVSTDELDINWQRLIMTHVLEKRHKGVLTGSTLTDVKITVIGGRSHPKHTEGGDFRQATYRAVRHGLMYNTSLLLEPYYDFCLEVPAAQLGRAMTDITRLSGQINTHYIQGDKALLFGRCPVATMHGYSMEVTAYTKGEGKLSVSPGGYDKCHNSDEIIALKSYNPEADLHNTPDSVFCAHGAGFVVPWNEVYDYMHVERKLDTRKARHTKVLSAEDMASRPKAVSESVENRQNASSGAGTGFSYSASARLDSELSEIFNRTYGSPKQDKPRDVFSPLPEVRKAAVLSEHVDVKRAEPVSEYLLVDGYNIIFSWDELNELSKSSLEGARRRLMDILCNYQGFRQMTLILVFDAYKVEGATEKVEQYHNIHVVYTKEAETADRYIEKTVKSLVKKYHVTVATSDATEQIIIWGAGALRMSAKELKAEVNATEKQIDDVLKELENARAGHSKPCSGTMLIDTLPKEVADYINSIRLK